ncbi:hypothetical protein [Bosea sp. 685]
MGAVGQREQACTLRTKDPAEARTAHAKVAAEIGSAGEPFDPGTV